MSLEKFIRGKKDSHRHDGRYSNRKREQEADNRVILDLCGGTGSWSKPYKEAGYDVRVITLPENDIRTYHPPKNVYGVLAAPPCTMFSLARTNAKTPRDLVSAWEIVTHCLRVVAECQYDEKWLAFWAMENPRGYLRQFLGKPALTFEHWQFDKSASHCKPTDLWGKFKTPKWKVKTKPKMSKNRNNRSSNWQSPPVPKEYKHLNLDRSGIRAITPQGFAQAFFEANQ